MQIMHVAIYTIGNAIVVDVFSKGKFRSMLWIKFDSMSVRDRVVSTLSKSRLSFDSAAIWMSGDAPLPVRVEKRNSFSDSSIFCNRRVGRILRFELILQANR